MEADYQVALKRLLVHEGGYSNDRRDPGGPTNFGITIYDYRKYVKPGATAADVRAMTEPEAAGVYHPQYWQAMRCQDLPAGFDDCVFDYSVNSGNGRVGKVIRRLVGLPDNTSIVSDIVIEAVRKRDPVTLIDAMCDERMRFLRGLSTFSGPGGFGAGWTRRVAEVRAFDKQLALHVATPVSTPVPGLPTGATGPGKGHVPPPKGLKRVVVSTGGGPIIAAQHPTVQQWIGAHPGEAGLIVVGGALAIAGVVYGLNRWHRAMQEAPTPNLIPVPALPH